MTDEKAKVIYQELMSINKYQSVIEEIKREIVDIQTPSCPNSGNDVKIENHQDKTIVINALYSEMQEYERIIERAKRNYIAVINVCDREETLFFSYYISGMNHWEIKRKFGYENPYRSVIRLIKRIE